MYDRIAATTHGWTYRDKELEFDPKEARKFEKLLVRMLFSARAVSPLNDTPLRLFDLMLRALGRDRPYADYERYARESKNGDIEGQYAVMLWRQLLFLTEIEGKKGTLPLYDAVIKGEKDTLPMYDAADEAIRTRLMEWVSGDAFDEHAFIQANIDYDLPEALVTYATIWRHNGIEEAGRRFVRDFLRLYWGEMMNAMGLLDEVYFALEHNAFAQGFSDKITNTARKGKPVPPDLDYVGITESPYYTGDVVYSNGKLQEIDGEQAAYIHALRRAAYGSAWRYYNDHLEEFPFPENRQDPRYSMKRLLDAYQQGLGTKPGLLKDYFAEEARRVQNYERGKGPQQSDNTGKSVHE